jgi:hypothetical protein
MIFPDLGGKPYSRGIVVITVDRENRYRNIDVRILVVDMIEGTSSHVSPVTAESEKVPIPLKGLAGIAEHFQLTGLLSKAIHPQRPHNLIHGLPRRLVLVK